LRRVALVLLFALATTGCGWILGVSDDVVIVDEGGADAAPEAGSD